MNRLVRPVTAASGGMMVTAGFFLRWASDGVGSTSTGFQLLGDIRNGNGPQSSHSAWLLIAIVFFAAIVSLGSTLWTTAMSRAVSLVAAAIVVIVPLAAALTGLLPITRWSWGIWLVVVGGLVLLMASVLPDHGPTPGYADDGNMSR